MNHTHVRPRRNSARPKRKALPRSCGKRWFKDRISAQLALAAIQHHGKDRSGRIPKRAYECLGCKGWHLTSQEERPSSSRVAARGQVRVPRPRHAESSGPERKWSLRTTQGLRARRVVQGLEPWVVAHVETCLAEHGHGPTWRELEAVFGWDRWQGALVIRHLVDEGWLREEPASPHILPASAATGKGRVRSKPCEE